MTKLQHDPGTAFDAFRDIEPWYQPPDVWATSSAPHLMLEALHRRESPGPRPIAIALALLAASGLMGREDLPPEAREAFIAVHDHYTLHRAPDLRAAADKCEAAAKPLAAGGFEASALYTAAHLCDMARRQGSHTDAMWFVTSLAGLADSPEVAQRQYADIIRAIVPVW